MKMHKLVIAIAAGIGLVLSASGHAGTVVTEVDNDTLRVTEFSGKPPHKRFTVHRSADPELYARYAELREYPRPSFVALRSGAPGKSLPRGGRQVRDAQEVTEFARFEEGREESDRGARNWRGAPGKGRAFK